MSTNNIHLVVILSIITIFVILVLGISMILVYHIHKKEFEKISTYQINIGASINEEIPNILEKYAQNIFTDYRLKFLDMQYMGKYISDDQQVVIIKEFGEICANRFSPAMMDKLSLFWRREAIGEVLTDKIYLIVVNYVASHNAVKPDNTEKTIAI